MKNRAAVTTIFVAVVALLSVLGWLNDFVTLHGARTVYTANCAQGEWRGAVCTGTLKAGERYRFRVLKPRGEVIFWVAGSPEPSGKLAPCAVENAKEWSCKLGADSSRTITHAMKYGHAVPEPKGPARRFHPVAKWKWLLLDLGVSFFRQADG